MQLTLEQKTAIRFPPRPSPRLPLQVHHRGLDQPHAHSARSRCQLKPFPSDASLAPSPVNPPTAGRLTWTDHSPC